MISYEIYKLLHLVGIFTLFSAFGGAILREAPVAGSPDPTRKLLSMLHGVGLLLILVAGFGMLARLGLVTGLPGWIYAKLGVWLILGGWIVLAHKRKLNRTILLGGAVLLGAVAGALALWK